MTFWTYFALNTNQRPSLRGFTKTREEMRQTFSIFDIVAYLFQLQEVA